MKLLFRILKSSFTDRLAYVSAVAAALCWLLHELHPALVPAQLRAVAHIYVTSLAALAAGVMLAKYAFKEGYLSSLQQLLEENEAFAALVQKLEVKLQQTREENELTLERESLLKKKLTSMEGNAAESQLSSLRKRIRLDEEDRKTALAFLVQALKSRLQELYALDDKDVVRAAVILQKETQMLENEIKKGDMSFYELVISMNEIREHVHDLSLLRSQSGTEGGAGSDRRQTRDFSWFDAQADPTSVDRLYKFLKVAFHPDRFSSDRLKEEAKIHFQEAVQAYSSLKERLRTSH